MEIILELDPLLADDCQPDLINVFTRMESLIKSSNVGTDSVENGLQCCILRLNEFIKNSSKRQNLSLKGEDYFPIGIIIKKRPAKGAEFFKKTKNLALIVSKFQRV